LIWVQAKIEECLVGWATFATEPEDADARYMNLLIVDPKFQGLGVGKSLVFSLKNLGIHPNLQRINLFVRKVNQRGYEFYDHLGFTKNLNYQRTDNHVQMKFLEALTWEASL